jgi:hypothetical protein
MARKGYMSLMGLGILSMIVSIAFGAAAVGTKWAELRLNNPILPTVAQRLDVGIFNSRIHQLEKLWDGRTCADNAYLSGICAGINNSSGLYAALDAKNCETECRPVSGTARTKFDFKTKDYTDWRQALDSNQDCYNFDAPVGLLIAALALQTLLLILSIFVCIFTGQFGFSLFGLYLWMFFMLCSFVLQIVGFILAVVFCMRPCDGMADMYDAQVSMAFGFGLASLILTSVNVMLFLCALCSVAKEQDEISDDEVELRTVATPMAMAPTIVPTVMPQQMMAQQMPMMMNQQYPQFPPVQGLYEQPIIMKDGMGF